MFSNYGRKIRNYFSELLYFSTFLQVVLTETLLFWKRKQVTLMVLLRQILFTGFEALSLITLIGLAIGGIIIIQGMSLLENFGQSDLVYRILIIIITKELGPVITAFIIIARSGTAISTELGNMVVNHEVEALNSIGVDPIGYLVVPRVLGVIVSLFCLTIYLNVSGLFGGYLVSTIVHPSSFVDFMKNLSDQMSIGDILLSQFKSLVFGFVIAVIACYQGLKVGFASTEVPQRTIKAVVSSLSWVIIFDILITVISYGFLWE